MTTAVRPTRRTVVRSAAWTAPAVAIAVGAPPAYATSTTGQLVLSLGNTVITADNVANYVVQLAGASVTVSGKSLPAGQLSLTIDYVPNTGSPAHQLYRNDAISSWATGNPPNTALDALVFTYQSSAAAGASIALAEATAGAYLCQLAGDKASTTGTLRFTVSAPNFLPSVVTRSVPPPTPSFQLDPGQTALTVTGVLPHRTYGLYLDKFLVTPANGSVAPSQLSLHASFVPASGGTSTQFRVTPTSSQLVDWPAQQAANQPVLDAVFQKVTGVSQGQPTELGESLLGVPFLRISDTESTQQGAFRLRFLAPGFTTAQYDSPTFPPPPGNLVFNPGASSIRQDPASGLWGLRFSGATLTLPEPVEGGYLTMSVTYSPTLGPNTLQYAAAGPAGWAAPAGTSAGTTSTQLTYTLQTQSSGVLPIQNGMFFNQSLAPSAQRGTMTITFSGPHLNPAAYSVTVTNQPYLEILNPQAIQLNRMGADQWSLDWSRHTLQAAGAPIPAANTLTLLVERAHVVSGYSYATFVRSVDNWTPQVTAPVLFELKTFTYPGAPSTWVAPQTGLGGTLAVGSAAGPLTYVTGYQGQVGTVRMTYSAPGFSSAVVERPLP